MARDPERPRDSARRLNLTRVPLAVLDRQRVQREPLLAGDRGGRVRVEPAAQKDDCLHTPRVSGGQMNLCSCS